MSFGSLGEFLIVDCQEISMYRDINAPGQANRPPRLGRTCRLGRIPIRDRLGRITDKISRRGDPPLHIAMHIATYVSQYLCISRDARGEINASGRESVILSDCWDNIHQTPESMVIHAVLKTSLNTKEAKQTGRRGGTFTPKRASRIESYSM